MGTSPVRAGHAPETVQLPFAAASVSLARQRLQAWLTEQDVARDTVEDARVVVSELVANSIRHARPLADGNLLVSWMMERRRLQVSVTDGGSATRPRIVRAASSALAGRGMAIVESMTSRWWAERTESRATVYAVLDVV